MPNAPVFLICENEQMLDPYLCPYHIKTLLINYYIIVLDMMKTAIIIQLEQLSQYRTKSANTDYFLVLADFDPVNIGVQESL